MYVCMYVYVGPRKDSRASSPVFDAERIDSGPSRIDNEQQLKCLPLLDSL